MFHRGGSGRLAGKLVPVADMQDGGLAGENFEEGSRPVD